MDESKPKRKTTTSTAVKRRYNAKTYSVWSCQLRKDEFAEIEALRGGMSRPQFLRMLVERYKGEP